MDPVTFAGELNAQFGICRLFSVISRMMADYLTAVLGWLANIYAVVSEQPVRSSASAAC